MIELIHITIKPKEIFMNVKSSQYNNKGKNSKRNSLSQKHSEINFYLLPIVFISSFLPLIMRFHEYNTKLSDFTWFKNETAMDAFLYFKQIFFLIACSIMILIVGYKIYKEKHLFHLPVSFLPLMVYGILTLLSTLFSDYSSFGFTGIYEQFESVFVLLGYCLIVYYSFLFVKSEEDIRFIVKYLIIGILLLSALGLTQIIGHDLIGSNLGEHLVLPSKYWGKLGLDFKFGLHRVYLTLYNPNYVGVYVALILPFLIGLLFTEKNRRQIILYLTAIGGMVICLIGSQSKTSLISFFIAFIFILLFFRKYIFHKSKVMFIIIGTASVSIALFIIISLPKITDLLYQFTQVEKTAPALTDIKTEDKLTIIYKGNDLNVNFSTAEDTMSVQLSDNYGANLLYNTNDSGSLTIDDPRFSGITFSLASLENILCLQFNIEGKNWIFTNQLGDNTFYYLNISGKFDKINSANSSLFTGYEKFASGRGYIWSRTIPLLKDTILLGTGADTFLFAFPHQDYVNLFNYGFDNQLITRPHNTYLQIGVQTGVLSMIAYILFYFLYFISSVKLYWKGIYPDYFYRVGVSIFIGTISYMIAGLSNDSTITVAPVFWVLIGIGTVINSKLILQKNISTMK